MLRASLNYPKQLSRRPRLNKDRPTVDHRIRPNLRTVTRRISRDLGGQSGASDTSGFNQQLFEWAKARTTAITVDVNRLDEEPGLTDTVLLPPW